MSQIWGVIFGFAYKTVHPKNLVSRNADLVNETTTTADCTKRRHEPAVTCSALPNIVGRRALWPKEPWSLEDLTHAFDALRIVLSVAVFEDKAP